VSIYIKLQWRVKNSDTWSRTCWLRINIPDPSRAGWLVSISRSSALETRFPPFVSPSWSAS